MENIFLSSVQFVSDNRFWIMPIILAVVAGGIGNVFVTGFRGE